MKDITPKKKCTFRLSESTSEYIAHEAAKIKISQAAFVEHIIEHHQKAGYLNVLEDIVTRTHKSVSYTDRGVQQILVMLNKMCYEFGLNDTLKKNDNVKTEIYSNSNHIVSERIKKAQIGRSGQLY